MTPELYTDEFRNFKYLKSSQLVVEYSKNARSKFNQVRPADQVDNDEFAWSSRIEFIEQLLDLRHEMIYIVEAGELVDRRSRNNRADYSYEAARLHEVFKPRLVMGHPMTTPTKFLELEDIPKVENNDPRVHAFLCSEQGLDLGPTHINFRSFGLAGLSLIPQTFFNYTAIFYNELEAREYCTAITAFLRKNVAAISAISNLL